MEEAGKMEKDEEINQNIHVITININALCISVKRQLFSENSQKQYPATFVHVIYKNAA